jgi:hypothetical protein
VENCSSSDNLCGQLWRNLFQLLKRGSGTFLDTVQHFKKMLFNKLALGFQGGTKIIWSISYTKKCRNHCTLLGNLFTYIPSATYCTCRRGWESTSWTCGTWRTGSPTSASSTGLCSGWSSTFSSTLKGCCHENKILVDDPKKQNRTFWTSTYGFTILSCLFCEGNPIWSFYLLLWNHLRVLIVKFLPVTLFRELVPAF